MEQKEIIMKHYCWHTSVLETVFKLHYYVIYESLILTAASPVYNVDHLLKRRASSDLHLLHYYQSDPVLSDVRSLISELNSEQHNLHLWCHNNTTCRTTTQTQRHYTIKVFKIKLLHLFSRISFRLVKIWFKYKTLKSVTHFWRADFVMISILSLSRRSKYLSLKDLNLHHGLHVL